MSRCHCAFFYGVYLSTLLVITGCNNANVLIPESGLDSIVVERGLDTISIKNSAKTRDLVEMINNNDSALIKFMPEYWMHIYYPDTIIYVGVSGHAIKINGVTFQASKNIGSELSELMSTNHAQ